MDEKINIKQIAQLAGVSVATVSRIINQNGRFSAETERRVLDIIQKHHYVPNAVAKGLRTNKTPVIGLIVPDIVNSHFASLVLELEKSFFARGYSTVICNTNESRELEQRHMQTLIAQQVAGIVFISGKRRYAPERDVPVIYVDRRPEDADDSAHTLVIESDNEAGGYLAARKLLEQGCRNVAILLASQVDYNHRARQAGWRRALEESGLAVRPEQVIDVAQVSFDAARQAVESAIDRGAEFDGLLCTADTLAIGAVLGLRGRGKGVPEDVLITGFDDTAMAAAYNPAITSVHQCVDRMAACAAELMLELAEDPARRDTYRKLPVYLVERESTARKITQV